MLGAKWGKIEKIKLKLLIFYIKELGKNHSYIQNQHKNLYQKSYGATLNTLWIKSAFWAKISCWGQNGAK